MENNIEFNKKKALINAEDIAFAVRILRKNILMVLSMVIIAAAVGYLYTYKMVDIYAAQTQVLLKNKETGFSTEINQGIGFPWWNDYYKDYADEINILKSHDLVQRAVEKLDLNVSYYITGRLRTTEVYENLPFKITLKNVSPNFYETAVFVKIINPKQVELKYSFNGKERVENINANEVFSNDAFMIQVSLNNVTNQSIKQLQEINYYAVFHDKNTLTNKFKAAISASVVGTSTIMTITVNDEIPKRAVTFLDTLTKLYTENTLQTKYQISDNTLNYIDKQLVEVTNVLTGIEDNLENYKSSKSILDLGEQEKDYFGKLSKYDGESSELNLKLGTIEALEKYIIENKDPVLLPPSVYVLNDDQFLIKSVNELYTMQIARINQMYSTNEGNEALKITDEKMGRVKGNLLVYLVNLRKALIGARGRVNKQIGAYENNIKTIPKKQRDILNIERKLQVNEKMYLFLLEKRANTIITKAGLVPETKIIEVSRSIGIVAPNKKEIISTFVGIAAIIGLILVFLRTMFFDKIESVDELKLSTARPIIGEIQQSKESLSSYLVVNANPKAPITESFRTFRTNLEYLISDKKESRVILITSYNPGEGKTFCSLNLSTLLAKSEKKVLVVEMDMHRPKVHKGLNVVSDVGMSNFLSGQLPIEAVIKTTSIDNLSTIVCGPIPPNASELILNNRMQDLIAYAKANFDYLILDTPPIGLITDGIVLMKYTDANIFVLNTGYTNKRSVENAEEIFKINNIEKVSYILNGVKRNNTRNYNGAYGYLYGYGYSYVYGYSYSAGYASDENKPWYKRVFES
jgi:capsular exopolysaccharide synthesis family protein